MPWLRSLSGRALVRVLGEFGFKVVSVRGSHAKLRRPRADGGHDTMTLPLHQNLAPGTTLAIFRQAIRFIPEGDLRPYFYMDN